MLITSFGLHLILLLLIQFPIFFFAFSLSTSLTYQSKHLNLNMNSIETESTVSVNQSQNNSKPGLSIKKKHTVVAYSGDNTTVYSGKVSALKPTFGFIIFSFNASETSVYFQLSAYQDTIPIQKGSNVQFTLASDSSERSRAVNIHIVNSTTQITTTNVSRDTSIKPLIQSDNQTKAEISIESSTLKLQPKVSPPLFDGPSSGFKANVAWRAVEMNDLRLHPLFKELEVTENIQVQSAQDFSRFRQDSWQWDALHQGRLTTSRAAACLGFYEVKAGQAMTIPSSLLGHERTLGSWQVLMETAPQDWSYLNENKNNVDSESMSKGQKGSSGTSSASSSSATAVSSRSIWKPSVNGGSKRFPFAYTPMKGSDRAHIPLLYPNPRSARLAWGSTQEATGILVLVNYLHSLGRGSTVSESGLLPSEVLDPSFEPLLKEWVSGSIDESTGFAFLNRSCPLLGKFSFTTIIYIYEI